MPPSSPRRRRFLPDPDLGEATFVGRLLRQETVGGGVVLVAALVAVVWANSSFADAYDDLAHVQVGPLDLEALGGRRRRWRSSSSSPAWS